ncbi:helix-turn-helix domain-containing protein [Haloarchaeobius sp. HME9146]|uniref:helix-turn-helix domain-containing protein n=1 Tax=Haloarchaeobius sp. HME9146 TaxID=2978732 RepID=UPI0021C16E22|nr:helix-turn-helix domain-containing protein [Haloarchaeobius sp. HME9146]MCT9095683.1 helix-turn-helix domain-containing protein [Haloarchaeobius sp. HME9146]
MSSEDTAEEPAWEWRESPFIVDLAEEDAEAVPRLVETDSSPLIAEVHLVNPDLLLSHCIATVPGVTIRPEYQTVLDSEVKIFFFTVTGDAYDDFEAALVEDHTVADPTLVSEKDTYRVYRVRLLPDTQPITPATAKLDIRVVDAKSSDGGWLVRLEIPNREALLRFRDFCDDEDVHFSIRRLYTDTFAEDAFLGLTETQLTTLRTAFDTGYFDVPRRISQQQLADLLGISTSGVSQRLRSALSQLIEHTVAEDD